MKPYYSNDVHFTATAEEFQMARVAISCWLRQHEDWQNSISEDAEYWKKQFQLFKDITVILEQLPF